ncbi:hypothetical protein [Paenibacillus sp. HW567]|uniref:hypothetical protein n=1 Tax=Paenibacillus sp. HW567 TaxID=1034769 RepID=UPI0003809D9D|nr:hypothetical protein [Paenibacillus sp. HW567]
MSDFMKNIVSEVLLRNHQPAVPGATGAAIAHANSSLPASSGVSSPSRIPGIPGAPDTVRGFDYSTTGVPTLSTATVTAHACTANSKADCPHTCLQPGNCRKPSGEIKRINYQKEKAEQRLALINGAAGAGQLQNRQFQNRQFAEQCLSPLLLRTLPVKPSPPRIAGANSLAASVPSGPAAFQVPGSPEPCRLPAAEGIECWLFPEISSRLRPLLGISGRNSSSAGLLLAPACHPGQLFAVEDLLAAEPGLETDVSWRPAGSGFELMLFSSDAGRITRHLTEMAGRLHSEASRPVQVYVSPNPGPLLRRHLGAGLQEAIAVIDTGSRWSSIGTAERLLYSQPNAGLSLRAEDSCCIISGTPAQITALGPALNSLMVEQRQQAAYADQ